MPRHQLRDVATPRVHDTPLPGMVEVVTLQLNVTYYSQGTCRWVGSLRDPVGGVEFDRVIGVLQDDTDAALGALQDDMLLLVASAEYQLRGGPLELQEALDGEVPPPSDPPKGRRRSSSAA